MMGTKTLVPKDDFYRRLEATLDLSFVRNLVRDCYASFGENEFVYDAEKDLYICPQGGTLRRQGLDYEERPISTPRALRLQPASEKKRSARSRASFARS